LTSLGIIFGVGSVIAMLAISAGAKKQALAQIEAMGIDNILINSQEAAVEESSSNSGTTIEYGLTNKDLEHISLMDNVKRITFARNTRSKIRKGIKRLDLQLVAVSPKFLTDTNSKITQGRWFTEFDFSEKLPVCVIGREAKKKLFSISEKSVIGRKITLGTGLFKIIGVMENNIGTSLKTISSPNSLICISKPLSDIIYTDYSRKISVGSYKIEHVQFDLFIVKVSDVAYIDNTANRIRNFLSKSHEKSKDWDIYVPIELLKQREKTQNIFTIVMGSIAAISLIVGGIGIMNIMLANVYERRKEIGTRRAIGATKWDILFQFLIETVFLTTMGGILGIGMGVSLAEIISYFSKMPAEVSLLSVIGSITISGIVGVVFGTYPAWQAANQNPIEALKSE
jgi:putative ABC transport system permease protein